MTFSTKCLNKFLKCHANSISAAEPSTDPLYSFFPYHSCLSRVTLPPILLCTEQPESWLQVCTKNTIMSHLKWSCKLSASRYVYMLLLFTSTKYSSKYSTAHSVLCKFPPND